MFEPTGKESPDFNDDVTLTDGFGSQSSTALIAKLTIAPESSHVSVVANTT